MNYNERNPSLHLLRSGALGEDAGAWSLLETLRKKLSHVPILTPKNFCQLLASHICHCATNLSLHPHIVLLAHFLSSSHDWLLWHLNLA